MFLKTHLKIVDIHLQLQLNKYVQDLQIPVPTKAYWKKLTVNLIINQTTLPSENAMVWQIPDPEGASSCLN